MPPAPSISLRKHANTVHAAFAPPDGLGYLAGQPDYAMLELLIELGADLEATDDKARTPLAVALLRGDDEATRLLRAAGAKEPPAPREEQRPSAEEMISAAKSVTKISPMFAVRDMRATVRWYQSIGFTLADEYEDSGELVFARLTFGNGEFTLGPGGNPGPRDVSLWFFTDRVEPLYKALRQRQLRAAGSATNADDGDFEVQFEEDLYMPVAFSLSHKGDILCKGTICRIALGRFSTCCESTGSTARSLDKPPIACATRQS